MTEPFDPIVGLYEAGPEQICQSEPQQKQEQKGRLLQLLLKTVTTLIGTCFKAVGASAGMGGGLLLSRVTAEGPTQSMLLSSYIQFMIHIGPITFMIHPNSHKCGHALTFLTNIANDNHRHGKPFTPHTRPCKSHAVAVNKL